MHEDEVFRQFSVGASARSRFVCIFIDLPPLDSVHKDHTILRFSGRYSRMCGVLKDRLSSPKIRPHGMSRAQGLLFFTTSSSRT